MAVLPSNSTLLGRMPNDLRALKPEPLTKAWLPIRGQVAPPRGSSTWQQHCIGFQRLRFISEAVAAVSSCRGLAQGRQIHAVSVWGGDNLDGPTIKNLKER